MDAPQGEPAAETDADGLLINALRRENQRLWAEIEARQAADFERAQRLSPEQRTADAIRAWQGTAPAEQPGTTQPAAAEQRLLAALTAALSLAVHEECLALSATLEAEQSRLATETETRLRTEQWDMYTALAARLDRLTSALEQVQDALRELADAHQAGAGFPVIIEYPSTEPDPGPAAPNER